MADIVNLRRARKQRSRREREQQAQDNRIRFGRTKSERKLTDAKNALENSRHEAGRLDSGDD